MKKFPNACMNALRACGVKRCPKCERILPLDSYANDKYRSDGKTTLCRQCVSKRMKAHREAHREDYARRAKEQYQKHGERRREVERQRYKRERGTILKRQKEWSQTPEGQAYRAEADRVRRARKRGVEEKFTQEDIDFCMERAGHKCESCGMSNEEHITLHGNRLHMDHILPLSEGYALTRDNCQVLCIHCNSRKGRTILSHEAE